MLRLPPQSSEHGRCVGSPLYFSRPSGTGPVQPASIRLRPDHSRSMRKAGSLRCRTPRHGRGDEGSRKGWCLYKMGCKGPEATFNCPVVQWNDHTSWPIPAGHGCIGCASRRIWDTISPFYDRLPSVPGFGVEVSAGEIGMGLVGATIAGVTAHGLITMIKPAPKPVPPVTAPELRKEL